MLYQSSGDTLFSTEKEGITTRPWLWKGTYLSQLQDTTHPAITRGDPLAMRYAGWFVVYGIYWGTSQEHYVWPGVLYRSRKFLLSAKMLRGGGAYAPGPQWPSPRWRSSAADSQVIMRQANFSLNYEAAVKILTHPCQHRLGH